jgi:26S proteasome regulatory subunit N1
MAKDDEKKPTAADKGKGKAPVNGDAEKDAKNGKDAKPDSNDKKAGAATAPGTFGLCDTCRNVCWRREADI